MPSPWNISRPSSPVGKTYPTVYIPGESTMPPGISHELSWELTYDRHLQSQAVAAEPVGLLKADDQLHHAPSVKYQETEASKKALSMGTAPRRPQKRHFDPNASPLADHLINTYNGLSSI